MVSILMMKLINNEKLPPLDSSNFGKVFKTQLRLLGRLNASSDDDRAYKS